MLIIARRSSLSNKKRQDLFILFLPQIGHSLIVELNGIFPNCFGNDIFQMQRCIALKLGTANIAVKNLRKKTDSAKLTAKSASNDIVLQGNNCVYNIYSLAFSQITEVRLTVTRCLKTL